MPKSRHRKNQKQKARRRQNVIAEYVAKIAKIAKTAEQERSEAIREHAKRVVATLQNTEEHANITENTRTTDSM